MATVAEPKRRARAGRGGTNAGATAAKLETPATQGETAAATATGTRARVAGPLLPIVLHAVPGAPRGGAWNDRYALRDMESTGRVMDCGIKTGLSLDAFIEKATAGGGSVTFHGPPGEQGGGGGSGGGGSEGAGGSGPKRARKRTRTRTK